jgi:hypothetical protein
MNKEDVRVMFAEETGNLYHQDVEGYILWLESKLTQPKHTVSDEEIINHAETYSKEEYINSREVSIFMHGVKFYSRRDKLQAQPKHTVSDEEVLAECKKQRKELDLVQMQYGYFQLGFTTCADWMRDKLQNTNKDE